MKRVRLKSLLEAVGYYLAYRLAGVLAGFMLVMVGSVRVAVQYGSSRMSTGSESFLERVNEFTSGNPALGLVISYAIIFSVFSVIFSYQGRALREYAGIVPTRFFNLFGAVVSGVLLHYFTGVVMNYIQFPAQWQRSYGESIVRLMDGNVVIVAFVVVLLAPIMEELVFRGVLLTSLRCAVGTVGSVILTALLFALAHGSYIQIMYAFVLGLILAVVRLRSGSLLVAILLHISFNISNFSLIGAIIPPGIPTLLAILALFFSLALAMSPAAKGRIG